MTFSMAMDGIIRVTEANDSGIPKSVMYRDIFMGTK
jgi:hypothetical protein